MEWQAEPGRHRRPGDPRGWTRSWRAALLAASIFSSSFLLAQGQLASTTNYNISISKNPQETLEGQNVNLTLQHEAANFIVCNWYRGIEMKENLIVTYYLPPITGTTNGNSYTGREVVGFGCSLLIKNLNLNDTGTYMVIMNGPSVHGKGLVNIQVLAARLLVGQYWRKDSLPTIEWLLKVSNLAEMAKISAYLKDHSQERYISVWRRRINYVQNKYGIRKYHLVFD